MIVFLYHYFMEEAFRKDFVVLNYNELVEAALMNKKAATPTEDDPKVLSLEELFSCIL